MVASARAKPASIARDRRPAAAHLLADALVDQHVGVDRDADGQHDAGDAGQRQRRVEQRQHAKDHRDVDRHRDVGEQAEQAVGREHEDDDHGRAHVGRQLALLDRVLAEARADGAFLDDGQRRRQRAGAQQNGEVVRALDGEVAGNLARAAEDRLADHRGRDHLVVEHDGERLADVFLRHGGEAARAVVVETEGDDRLAVALVEAGLGVGQVLARDDDALLDHIGLVVLGLGALEQLGIRRHVALYRLIDRRGLVDQPERQLGGLAEQFLQPRRILQARHLHQDAIDALALDRRLDGAELVDAALDDLDRLFDRLADALDDGGLGRGEADHAVAGIDHVDRALAGGA